MEIRTPHENELPVLQRIERAAGAPFRALGMDAVADDPPPPLAELRRHLAADGLRVVAEPGGELAGYVLTEHVDGCAHVEQLSVDPRFARRGLGRALLDDAAHRAAGTGLAALTLTSFADVPWNAPYYARLGFRTLPETALTPGLREARRREREAGLDRWPRVCMRRDLPDRPQHGAR
ncbi:GNAT family N-acetyltransferase [Streptomyces sulphureus]|uniref:GNAT family N-acetyltransferase n=1 Tax=Streptomyces sulphureus TaxID=47758 RepID=UPI0003604FA3|nr:GNAT family N-acetyltransferase [Streptomyces sulphureus]